MNNFVGTKCRYCFLQNGRNAFPGILKKKSRKITNTHERALTKLYFFLQKSENRKNVSYCFFPWGGRNYCRRSKCGTFVSLHLNTKICPNDTLTPSRIKPSRMSHAGRFSRERTRRSPVTTMNTPLLSHRPRNYHEIATSHSITRTLPSVALARRH